MNNNTNETKPAITPKDVRDILEKLSVNPEKPVYIHDEWCKRCGICIAMCPHKALEWGPEGIPVVIDEKCKRCSMCEYRCPDLAITLLQTRN